MMAELLPETVVAVERTADVGRVWLYDEEHEVIRHAVPVRRREFATVRLCAREALQGLGVPPAPLLPGDRGAPAWPSGVVGSMTHCRGYRAAAVAFARDIAGIGIDAEPDAPLPDGVVDLVACGEERARMRSFSHTLPAIDRLVFSAKEALYKAWFPLARRWLDFHDAEVTINLDGTFVAEVTVPGVQVGDVTLTRFDGRWSCLSGLLISTVVVPATMAPDEAVRR